MAVVPYRAERYSETTAKIRWKPEEIEVLEQCLKGKLHPYQAAIMLGRSINSVVKKVNRMKVARK
jgi:DNA-binding CsgD family transcriptional regulator